MRKLTQQNNNNNTTHQPTTVAAHNNRKQYITLDLPDTEINRFVRLVDCHAHVKKIWHVLALDHC
jgi:hypothetical protein